MSHNTYQLHDQVPYNACQLRDQLNDNDVTIINKLSDDDKLRHADEIDAAIRRVLRSSAQFYIDDFWYHIKLDHLADLAQNKNIHDLELLYKARKICKGNCGVLNTFCEQLRESRPIMYIVNSQPGLKLRKKYMAIIRLAELHHISPFIKHADGESTSPMLYCFHGSDITWSDASIRRCYPHNCALSYFIGCNMVLEYGDNIRLLTEKLRSIINIIQIKYPQYLDHFQHFNGLTLTSTTSVLPSYYIRYKTTSSMRKEILARYGKSPDVINCIYNNFSSDNQLDITTYLAAVDINLIDVLRHELYDDADWITPAHIIQDYPRFLYHRYMIGHILDKKYWSLIAKLLFVRPNFIFDEMQIQIKCNMYIITQNTHVKDHMLTHKFNMFKKWYKTWLINMATNIILSIKHGAAKHFGRDVANIIISNYISARIKAKYPWP
jgi:hypothetical protein